MDSATTLFITPGRSGPGGLVAHGPGIYLGGAAGARPPRMRLPRGCAGGFATAGLNLVLVAVEYHMTMTSMKQPR